MPPFLSVEQPKEKKLLKIQSSILGLGSGDERVQEVVAFFGGVGFFVGYFFFFPLAFINHYFSTDSLFVVQPILIIAFVLYML